MTEKFSRFPDRRANANEVHRLDVPYSRALAAHARIRISRLRSAVEETRDRLLKSRRALESGLAWLGDTGTAESVGALSQRIQMLAASLEELHFRLDIELAAMSDDLTNQLGVADELHSLADFCALVDPSAVEPEAGRTDQAV